MSVNPNTLKVGATFIDNKLASQPVEYRIHMVEKITKENIVARHIASDNMRTFPLTPAVLKGLDSVPNFPDVLANLDCLVGKKVKVALHNGSTITGNVTAIRYAYLSCGLDGKDATELRQVQSIELDRSGVTAYHWNEISKIEQRK